MTFYTVREWQEKEFKKSHMRCYLTEVIGPSISILVEIPKEGYPIITSLGDLLVERPEDSVGINKIMSEVAREYFKEYGPCYLNSKYGKVFIDSADVESKINEILNKLVLF